MWDLNRLRLLRELELRGTIAAVAAALDYSPSNVSQQLAQLEREVGVALLEPDGRRLRLTGAGRIVARHAEEVIRLEERARARLAPGDSTPVTVRVATIASAARALVPGALHLLAARAPRVRVELAVVAPEHGLAELEAHRYDLVLAEQYPGHARERRAGVDHEHLGNDPIHVVVPPDCHARTLPELAERPWVLEPQGSAARHWALQQCRGAGFEPDVICESADLETHIALIASGHAVGILPDLVWARRSPALALIELPEPLERELFTAVRASSASDAGVRAVRAALQSAFVELSAR